jgi:hypothetical protein
MIDEFVLEYDLYTMKNKIQQQRNDFTDHVAVFNETIQDLSERINSLEQSEGGFIGVLQAIQSTLASMDSHINGLTKELNKTKLINLKQEIVIRTLNNLNYFDGYDMMADTFVTLDNIDMAKSIRVELFDDDQSIGRTQKAIIDVQQSKVTNTLLISQNGSSDTAIAQTFFVDKERECAAISLHASVYTNTYKPLIVRILDTLGGGPLAQKTISSLELTEPGWVDVDFSSHHLVLQPGIEYYIEVTTEDPYGYKIGIDLVDNYLPGTSFSEYGGTWTDNGYDIGFKVWCFPAPDENNATVFTTPKVLTDVPVSIIFEKEDEIVNGDPIQYFVSRDNGLNWKMLQSGISTDLTELPEGNVLVIKAYIQGDSRINAWGYVVTRGETP